MCSYVIEMNYTSICRIGLNIKRIIILSTFGMLIDAYTSLR